MNFFQIFTTSPFLIFRLNQSVYKFIDTNRHFDEYLWAFKSHLLSKFSNFSSIQLEIPALHLYEYFLHMNYVGTTIYSNHLHISSFYNVLRSFSYFYEDFDESTLSLGDCQLRNVYVSSNGFYLLDLGKQFGSQVSLYYDRARFLVHLIDSGFQPFVLALLQSDSDKDIIIHHMKSRCHYVFFKRLKFFNPFSAIYRLFLFYRWYFLNFNKL